MARSRSRALAAARAGRKSGTPGLPVRVGDHLGSRDGPVQITRLHQGPGQASQRLSPMARVNDRPGSRLGLARPAPRSGPGHPPWPRPGPSQPAPGPACPGRQSPGQPPRAGPGHPFLPQFGPGQSAPGPAGFRNPKGKPIDAESKIGGYAGRAAVPGGASAEPGLGAVSGGVVQGDLLAG